MPACSPVPACWEHWEALDGPLGLLCTTPAWETTPLVRGDVCGVHHGDKKSLKVIAAAVLKKKGRKSQKAPTETGAQTYLTLEEMRVKEGGTWGGKPCPNDRHSPEVLCQHTVSVVSLKPVPECQADSESLEYSMNKYLQYLLTTGSSGNSLKFLSAK